MASSSASGSDSRDVGERVSRQKESSRKTELAELKEKLKGLEEQKAAVLSEIGPSDLIMLGELNKDLDRVQAAITALFSGELYFRISASATHSCLV